MVISLSSFSLLLLVLEHAAQVLEAVVAPGHPGSLVGGNGCSDTSMAKPVAAEPLNQWHPPGVHAGK